MKKRQTIYEYFSNYTKEQVNEALAKLNDEERLLITKRYGKDLEHPVFTALQGKEKNKFIYIIYSKLEKILKNSNFQNKNEHQEHPQSLSSEEAMPKSLEQERKQENKEQLLVKETSVIESDQIDNLTPEDCLKVLELLRTPTFTQMMSALTPKEAVIISLKLGYIDEKYFANETIAQFLDITEEEVRETIKKVLLMYKTNINDFLNNVIASVTDQAEQKRTLTIPNANKE